MLLERLERTGFRATPFLSLLLVLGFGFCRRYRKEYRHRSVFPRFFVGALGLWPALLLFAHSSYIPRRWELVELLAGGCRRVVGSCEGGGHH